MLISQELFDETLLESQELLEYSDDEAVLEAISELESSCSSSAGGGSSSNVKLRLDHLSLTHPNSTQGQDERRIRNEFVEAVQQGKLVEALRCFHLPTMNPSGNKKIALLVCQSLLLQHDLFSSIFTLWEQDGDGEDNAKPEQSVQSVLEFLTTMMMPQKLTTRVTRDVQLRMTQQLQNHWFRLYLRFPSLRTKMVHWARLSCYGCEPNKKAFVQAAISQRIDGTEKKEGKKQNGLELLLESLPNQLNLDVYMNRVGSDKENDSDVPEAKQKQQQQQRRELGLAKEICLLMTVLGKFQASHEEQPSAQRQQRGNAPPEEPVVSSAHANVLELHKCGAVPRFHRLAKQLVHTTSQDLSLEQRNSDDSYNIVELSAMFLSVLRVMAIDNDIVQNMTALGIIETAEAGLAVSSSASLAKRKHEEPPGDDGDDDKSSSFSPLLAAATLGLIRNLCANDELKTSVCKRSLPSILQAMELHVSNPSVQEHGCGILSAMALREPDNARAIINANGPQHIIQAMRSFPNNVPLQRQGALSFRNLSSRLTVEEKAILLDYGAENILRDVTARHQGSIDEAYAALRDLGCKVAMYNIDEHGNAQGTKLFGKIESNFRPVYDD